MPVQLTAVLQVPVQVPDTTGPVTVPELQERITPEQQAQLSMPHQGIPSPQLVPAVLPVPVPQEQHVKTMRTVTEVEPATP